MVEERHSIFHGMSHRHLVLTHKQIHHLSSHFVLEAVAKIITSTLIKNCPTGREHMVKPRLLAHHKQMIWTLKCRLGNKPGYIICVIRIVEFAYAESSHV